VSDLTAAVAGLLLLRGVALARDVTLLTAVVAGRCAALWAVAGLMGTIATCKLGIDQPQNHIDLDRHV